MAKASKIDAIIAEMKAEKAVIDTLIGECSGNEVNAADIIESKSAFLGACIARLSGSNGSEPAPKPTRARRGRKATEPSL